MKFFLCWRLVTLLILAKVGLAVRCPIGDFNPVGTRNHLLDNELAIELLLKIAASPDVNASLSSSDGKDGSFHRIIHCKWNFYLAQNERTVGLMFIYWSWWICSSTSFFSHFFLFLAMALCPFLSTFAMAWGALEY